MGGDERPFGACAGCGAMLPGSTAPWDRRSTASEACHQLYGRVAGFESQHVVQLGRWHQLLVDTYAAQHAGEQVPAISVAFALIGLHLALDAGWGGLEVRDAHQRLARDYRTWPRFAAPSDRGDVTVADLVTARTPDEYVERLNEWALSVWAVWSDAHAAVRALVLERLAPATGR